VAAGESLVEALCAGEYAISTLSPDRRFIVFLGKSFHPADSKRKLHTQATELSKTFSVIQPSEEKRIAARGYHIPQTAVAESYYWRGRLGVVLLEIRGARSWLEKAWKMCPEEAWQQRR
jgi:hypothetical protein